MSTFEVLKNRLTNLDPFSTEVAVKRILALANTLEITQEQAEKLIVLANQNGSHDALTTEQYLHDLDERLLLCEKALIELAKLIDGGSQNG